MHNRRWYDQQANWSQSVDLLSRFPDNIQDEVAESMIRYAQREFNIDDLANSLKSVGPEKVLGVYKSREKRRKLDESSRVYKALTCYYVLGEEERNQMAFFVYRVTKEVFHYLEVCREGSFLPLESDIMELTSLLAIDPERDMEEWLERRRVTAKRAEVSGVSGEAVKITFEHLTDDLEGLSVRSDRSKNA